MNNLIDGRLAFELKHLADLRTAFYSRIVELEQVESTSEDLQLIFALKHLEDALVDLIQLFNQLSAGLSSARQKVGNLHA